MIVIVNYGIGNLDSVLRAFRSQDADVRISSNPGELAQARGVVLPGVGSFGKAMEYLTRSDLFPVLQEKVLEEKRPILGICLGFQMFTTWSEEGGVEGLGWVDAQTKRFNFDGMDPQPKMPHMGWNDLQRRKESPLFEGIHPSACFYFAHSYCVSCNDRDAVLAETDYGYKYVSAVQKENIFGTQFHPEKSHANGLQMVRNFIGLAENA